MIGKKGFIYDKEFIKDNLEEILIAVPFKYYKEGYNWYNEAHELAKKYSKKYKIPEFVAAGLIATLSPQKSWPENIRLTELFLNTKGLSCGHTSMIHGKALRIYKAKSKEEVDRILNGRKIVNFYNNIHNPVDNDYACMDSHMIQLCVQDYSIKTCTAKQYDFLKEQFIGFAKSKNFPTSMLQATLWTYFRQNKRKNFVE